MKLIVGLGNPGKEYKDTRHNVGFMFVDNIVDKLNLKFKIILRSKTLILILISSYLSQSVMNCARLKR